MIKNIKKDFPWFNHNKGWTYLDSSATSLKPQCVINTIVNFYQKWSSNPHNSDSDLTFHVSKMIDDSRSKLANLIGAKKEEIIFTSGATESLSVIAHGLKPYLKKNDEIVITYGEHTSNILPWMELCKATKAKLVFAGTPNNVPTKLMIAKVITKNTKIVAFANISNLIAYELDPQKLVKLIRAKNKNVMIVCDATQSIPHKRLDFHKCDLDFVVCSAHKMLACTGIGALCMKSKYFEMLSPLRFGGGMNNNVTTCGYTYAKGVDKFEGGSPHTEGIISWAAAIGYLNAYGWDKLHQHEIMLRKYINQEFAKLKNVDLLYWQGKYPIIAFNIKGFHAQDVASYLGHQKIIVRSGLSCAKLAHHIIKEQAVIRASFYLYNDKKDVDVLVNAIKNIKKGNLINYVI